MDIDVCLFDDCIFYPGRRLSGTTAESVITDGGIAYHSQFGMVFPTTLPTAITKGIRCSAWKHLTFFVHNQRVGHLYFARIWLCMYWHPFMLYAFIAVVFFLLAVFTFMSTFFQYPTELSGEELDDFLARGWFRMQQSIFTCRYLFQDGMLSTAIWIRLPLKDYSFSKSLRKINSKNGRKFEVRYGPAEITAEKELLFCRYRENFAGRLSNSLYETLGLGRENIIYSSMQTEIRDNGELVAFSIFDCGQSSIQSISGIYDPEYAEHSLGLYTMLLEVQYGLEHGYSYFYPGYIAPGRPIFEYKLRTHGTEFYEPNIDIWLPISQLDRAQLPSAVMNQKLNELTDLLLSIDPDFMVEKYLYPPHQLIASNVRLSNHFDAPLFLDCFYDYAKSERLFVEYQPEDECFRIGVYVKVRDLEDRFHHDPVSLHKQFYAMMVKISIPFDTYSIEDAAHMIFTIAQNISEGVFSRYRNR